MSTVSVYAEYTLISIKAMCLCHITKYLLKANGGKLKMLVTEKAKNCGKKMCSSLTYGLNAPQMRTTVLWNHVE